MKTRDRAAFPTEGEAGEDGMTYREWLIGMALTRVHPGMDAEAAARRAVECADEVCRRLEEERRRR